MNKTNYEQYDKFVLKKNPERQISHLLKNCWSLTEDCTKIIALAGGYQSVDQYKYESDVTPRIHQITKPFFFLSALDDQFFGPNVIPIDHCYD